MHRIISETKTVYLNAENKHCHGARETKHWIVLKEIMIWAIWSHSRTQDSNRKTAWVSVKWLGIVPRAALLLASFSLRVLALLREFRCGMLNSRLMTSEWRCNELLGSFVESLHCQMIMNADLEALPPDAHVYGFQTTLTKVNSSSLVKSTALIYLEIFMWWGYQEM
jgi:hypothetical protein